jgi:hypothetical protein
LKLEERADEVERGRRKGLSLHWGDAEGGGISLESVLVLN